MKDGLQNVTVTVSDIGILPVERDAVSGTVLMPEAQDAGASRNDELLIERAVSGRLASFAAAAVRCAVAARQR